MANQLPTIDSYGEYSSDNYGAHALRVTIGSLTVYFSYKTPVAYRSAGQFVCRENDWGPTTGKHLNWIQPDKKRRIPGSQFEEQLQRVTDMLTTADLATV